MVPSRALKKACQDKSSPCKTQGCATSPLTCWASCRLLSFTCLVEQWWILPAPHALSWHAPSPGLGDSIRNLLHLQNKLSSQKTLFANTSAAPWESFSPTNSFSSLDEDGNDRRWWLQVPWHSFPSSDLDNAPQLWGEGRLDFFCLFVLIPKAGNCEFNPWTV